MVNNTIIILGDIMIQTAIRTIFFYFFITLAYRIMGKREVGQLGIIDLAVSILIAELVALGIEKYNENIFLTIVPIVILVVLEVGLGYIAIKSRTFNKIFGGKPTLIINEGKLVYSNLVSNRYTLDDLLLELRQKGISSIEDVEYAFLEPNGKLSIFKYNALRIKKNLPLPIIIDGVIQRDTLKQLGKNIEWVMSLLEKNNVSLNEVFYAFSKKTHVYLIRK